MSHRIRASQKNFGLIGQPGFFYCSLLWCLDELEFVWISNLSCHMKKTHRSNTKALLLVGLKSCVCWGIWLYDQKHPICMFSLPLSLSLFSQKRSVTLLYYCCPCIILEHRVPWRERERRKGNTHLASAFFLLIQFGWSNFGSNNYSASDTKE